MIMMVSETVQVEAITRIITKKQVIKDFENLINPYCKQYHVVTHKPKQEICQIMIKIFKKKIKHKDDWFRKRIDQEYKSLPRIKNAEKRSNKIRKESIPEKINKLESELAQLTKTAVDYAKSG